MGTGAKAELHAEECVVLTRSLPRPRVTPLSFAARATLRAQRAQTTLAACLLALAAGAALLLRAFSRRRVMLLDFSVYRAPERCVQSVLYENEQRGSSSVVHSSMWRLRSGLPLYGSAEQIKPACRAALPPAYRPVCR